MKTEQPCLDDQMRVACDTALDNGMYACFLSGHDCTIEYIAGAACAWFGTGYDAEEYGYSDPVTGERQKIDTREKLREHDPEAWNVLRQLFDDVPWLRRDRRRCLDHSHELSRAQRSRKRTRMYRRVEVLVVLQPDPAPRICWSWHCWSGAILDMFCGNLRPLAMAERGSHREDT